MSEVEFIIIDHLYFVTDYAEFKMSTSFDDQLLKAILWQLMEKRWIKCLSDPETEIWPNIGEFDQNFTEYHYLATKQGLIVHNERSSQNG